MTVKEVILPDSIFPIWLAEEGSFNIAVIPKGTVQGIYVSDVFVQTKLNGELVSTSPVKQYPTIEEAQIAVKDIAQTTLNSFFGNTAKEKYVKTLETK